jgi:hypothetical protein
MIAAPIAARAVLRQERALSFARKDPARLRDVNQDVVRRIRAFRYRLESDSAGPSWLIAPGHAKGSLWSLEPRVVDAQKWNSY